MLNNISTYLFLIVFRDEENYQQINNTPGKVFHVKHYANFLIFNEFLHNARGDSNFSAKSIHN